MKIAILEELSKKATNELIHTGDVLETQPIGKTQLFPYMPVMSMGTILI